MHKIISNTTPIISLLKIDKLNLTGTLGILLKSKEKNLIESIKPLIDKALEYGIWFNPKLTSKVLELAKEK